jgi:hypothetical protein
VSPPNGARIGYPVIDPNCETVPADTRFISCLYIHELNQPHTVAKVGPQDMEGTEKG